MSSWTYTASNEANLMKIKYGKLIDKQFNKANVLFGRIKKMNDFVGKQIDRPVIQSIGGGVGSGSLPTANENKIGLASLSAPRSLYAVVSIDRQTMKAAKTDEGSFVRMTKFPVKIAVESFNRNLERMITRGDATGSGELFDGEATDTNVSGAGSAGDPYIVSLDTASTYQAAQFEQIEEGDILNIDSEVTELVVQAMTVTVAGGYATGTLSLVGSSVKLAADSGAAPLVEKIYLQGSKDNEIKGIKGVISATSGTYKGISVGRRWQSYQKSAASGALSTDLMNDVVLNVKRQCGESPKLILSSYHQYVKLLNILEDHKVYNLPARDSKFKGQISFSALEYMSADGPIPVVASRFMNADEMFFLNESHIELHCRPGGFEWFDDDGTVFLRETGDSYEARYGGYGELFVNPHFQGRLHTLAV
jgi:hypothetical protein